MCNQKSISIIIPVYNEQENISTVYTQVTAVLQSLQSVYQYEFIFINDGSKDASWSLLAQLALADPCVRAINFSRNFGHQAALTAGYAHAKGDAVITMDADLQDTPTLLLDMIHAWEKGFHIVYARRIDRKDNPLKRWTAYLYYALLDSVADVCIPRNVGDFRLLDKKVVALINQMPERSRYLRGMVAWTGFTYTFVDFKRPDRVAGITGYTWKKMFKLAFDGLTGFSTMPLKLALYAGVFMLSVGMGLLGYMSIVTMMHSARYSLVSWCMPIVIIFMGVQSLSMWALGEYVARMYEQQKGRPLYIIDALIAQEKELEICNAPSHRASTSVLHKERE